MTNPINIEQIKHLTIKALTADDQLMETLVLKGGNAIDLLQPWAPGKLSRTQQIRTYKREKGELAAVMGTKKSSKEKQTEDTVDIEKENLRKTVQQLQLEDLALNTLIDVAEDKFKITIREKARARKSSE